MDARTRKHHHVDDDTADEAAVLAESITAKRDRLLASLTLIAGIGVIIVIPFALRGGAEFFMPVTAALVVAIALVPLLEWFERRGVPSRLSAGLCVIIFLMMALFAIGSIVIPATDWVAQVPQKISKVRAALEPFEQGHQRDRDDQRCRHRHEKFGAAAKRERQGNDQADAADQVDRGKQPVALGRAFGEDRRLVVAVARLLLLGRPRIHGTTISVSAGRG